MITLKSQQPPRSKFDLSFGEWAIIIGPVTVSFFLWCIDNEILWHTLGSFLVLPGVMLLEIVRAFTGLGSIHGDRWDVLAIPLSALFFASVVILRRQLARRE